jgi:calcineurin-like phosphoesterase family protein
MILEAFTMIYIFTDPHFNHDKLIELGRPKDFEERLSKNIVKANLKKEDVLLCLGDVCIGNDENVHTWLRKSVDARLWLVLGNHDKKSNDWYLRHGWDWVGNTFTYEHGGKKLLFSHEPQPYLVGIDYNIHGHLHNNDYRSSGYPWVTNKHVKLAIEETDYKLVTLDQIVAKLV